MAVNKYPSEVIKIANSQIGYLEKCSNSCLDDFNANAGSGNYTKYWRDIYPSFQGQAWCLCFCVYCFVKAFGADIAKQLLLMTSGYDFYTPTTAQRFCNKKQWYTEPKVGDLIFFRSDSAERQGRWKGVHHVGLVYKVSGNTVYTIEGNTSSGSQVIPNGGAVCAKSYTWKNNCSIAGYGRPKYDCEPSGVVDIPITMDRVGLKIVGTSCLNCRTTPVNGAIATTYKNGTIVKCTAKAKASDGSYWFRTDCGYISGKYIQGWIKEANNKWWYVEEGYKYPSRAIKTIDGKDYAFDKEGWMITSDRICSDGSIK